MFNFLILLPPGFLEFPRQSEVKLDLLMNRHYLVLDGRGHGLNFHQPGLAMPSPSLAHAYLSPSRA